MEEQTENLYINILDLMENTFSHSSLLNKVAIQDNNLSLTYQECKNKIATLAKKLIFEGVLPGDRIGVLLDRGIEAFISIYSILFIGAAYVPLNINDSTTRISSVINDADIKFVISNSSSSGIIKDLKIKLFNIDKHNLNDEKVYPLSKIKHKELAIILYTSGSTGKPKLVAIGHSAVVSFVKWTQKKFNISKNDIVASIAPFTFDLSIFDIFTSVASGAKLVFIPKTNLMIPVKLSEFFVLNKITVLYTVPSILSFWSDKGNLRKFSSLLSIRTILFAGEEFNIKKLQDMVDKLPDVKFYNLYGPVETNVCCFWEVDKSKLYGMDRIPIGISACDAQLVINDYNSELLIDGPTKMLGYWKNDLNRIQGYHHSGDRVILNSENEYIYIGRIDRMFKFFGMRIEPGEIENVIVNNITQIKDAVVFKLKNQTEEFLVCCIVSKSKNIKKDYIMGKIKNFLPTYMLPSIYLKFSKLPLLLNGKKDYKKLENKACKMVENHQIIL